jgi:hypothetical protein
MPYFSVSSTKVIQILNRASDTKADAPAEGIPDMNPILE